jgi:O-acetyl-ADP-ribose deacetylase (regulator of RNase III)
MRDRIRVVAGDITKLDVDAIVNAANSSLLGGGGVDGAIHRAAGPGLLEECRKLYDQGGCPTGEARLTGGHRLRARHVIHTVGPVFRDGKHGEDELLACCYRNSLAIAREHQLRRLAFPAISTGAYRFPLPRATGIAVTETARFLSGSDWPEIVTFACFDQAAFEVYQRLLAESVARD